MIQNPTISSDVITSAFLITSFIKNGTLPEKIPYEEIKKRLNTKNPIAHVRPLLNVEWYEQNSDAIQITEKGRNAQQFIGEFLWIASSIDASLSTSTEIKRNTKGIVLASKLIGESTTYKLLLPKINEIIRMKNKNVICELGCATAEILKKVLSQNPSLYGIGIDLDPRACESASQNLAAYGVSDRSNILQQDINHLAKENLQNVDTLIAGFVLHDLDEIQQGLQNITEFLPYESDFLITELATDLLETNPFATCILTAHNLMNKTIPTIKEWKKFFITAGLRIISVETKGIMPGAVLFHVRKEKPYPIVVKAEKKLFDGHNSEVKIVNLVGKLPPQVALEEIAFIDMAETPNGISELHTHSENEIYFFPSLCLVEVQIDEDILKVNGPAAVVIPAGKLHRWRPLSVNTGDLIVGLFLKEEESL